MSFIDDISAELAANLADLGEQLRFEPPAPGVSVTVSGLWASSHRAIDPSTGVEVLSRQPVATVAMASLPDVEQGWICTRLKDGRRYLVVEPEPSEHELLLRIRLHKEA